VTVFPVGTNTLCDISTNCTTITVADCSLGPGSSLIGRRYSGDIRRCYSETVERPSKTRSFITKLLNMLDADKYVQSDGRFLRKHKQYIIADTRPLTKVDNQLIAIDCAFLEIYRRNRCYIYIYINYIYIYIYVPRVLCLERRLESVGGMHTLC